MKTTLAICALIVAFNAAATPKAPPNRAKTAPAKDRVVSDKPLDPESADYLRGALHYIYYWFLDSAHFFEQDQDKDLEFMVKQTDYAKDSGSHSVRYEVIIPDLNLGIDLVRANYRIEELGLPVTNDSFKIVAVYPNLREPGTNEGFAVRILEENRVFSELLKQRNTKSPPPARMMQKLRKSLNTLAQLELGHVTDTSQTFYIGPLSQFSNDIWIFWETGKKLIRFSSATDFTTDGYWQLLPLFTKVYDLDTDVVTSLEEVSGSNAYITKSWAGRIMYNCIVDGVKLVVSPAQGATSPR